MNINIPKKITDPVNRNNIVSIYGTSNSGNIKNAVSTHTVQSVLMGTFSKNNGSSFPNVQNNAGKRRKRINSHQTTIIKGQKWNVATNGVIPKRIKLCIGWDIMDQRCEVDASAFLLCKNEKVPSDDWFVFYGQNTSPDNSVIYKSNKDNSSLPDDAEIVIDLNRVRTDIQKVSICATIYESIKQNLNFGMVKNIYVRIVDEFNNEMCYIPIVDLPNEVTSLVIGELYRYNSLWKFSAVSAGYKRDLAQFCNIYGVELE